MLTPKQKEKVIKKYKLQYFFPLFLTAGIIVAAVSSNTQPLFSSLDDFVLFASEELNLEKEVQISSGDLGSNKEININKGAIITGKGICFFLLT